MKELIKNHIKGIKGFAEDYGIPYNTVRQWANGTRSVPDWLTKIFYSMRNKKDVQQIKIEDNPIKRKYYACIYHPKSDTIIRDTLLREEEQKKDYMRNWEDYENNPNYKTYFFELNEYEEKTE